MKAIPKPARTLSWRAVRRGKLYCAPACGGGCTIAEFDLAMAAACACARALGNGWVPDVYENLGWHWQVARTGLGSTEFTVSRARGDTAYWANLIICGKQECAYAESAQEAVQIVLRSAATNAAHIINALAMIGAPVKDGAIAGGRGQ
jgi:hypothetical protein